MLSITDWDHKLEPQVLCLILHREWLKLQVANTKWWACGPTGTVILFGISKIEWSLWKRACQFLVKLNIYQPWDFLSNPVVRTPPFHYRGTQVESLIEELRFHMLCGMARKKKKKKKSPCNSGYSKYLPKKLKHRSTRSLAQDIHSNFIHESQKINSPSPDQWKFKV